MSKRICFPLFLAGVLLAGTAWAADRLVPGQFATIQAAINAAVNGDSVIVSPGTYYERIAFNGKAITVRSTAPDNWSVIDTTIIDGAGAVVSFTNSETSTSVIKGFKITHGNNPYGPGINAINGRPTISYCRITNNTGSWGGGIYYWGSGYSGSISNCIITNNSASSGGGIYFGSASMSLTNCIIANNSASSSGGGIFNGTWNSIRQCTIYGNSASYGGGVYLSSDPCDITNCILWGNTAGNGPQIYRGAGQGGNINYNDIQGGWTGSGNINSDPQFVNAAALNFHIRSTSPCIDAGSNTGVTTDFENDSWPFDNPGINHGPSAYDIGADEYLGIFVDDTATGANNGTSWVNAFTSLQNALAAAQAGDYILIAQGVYKPDRGTGITLGDRNATFQLINNVYVRGGFKGGAGSDAFSCNLTQYPTVLSGDLTGNDTGGVLDPTRNENSYHVACGSGVNTTAVLDNCLVTAGNANGSSWSAMNGGGMYTYCGAPTASNCSFVYNTGSYGGGGMYNEGTSSYTGRPVVTGCTFTDNWGLYLGGGIFNRTISPIVTNCLFTANAVSDSGGAYCEYLDSASTISNCIFRSNTASYYGGAIDFCLCGATLVTNCIFTGNEAILYGGGAIEVGQMCEPTMKHCTIVGNHAGQTAGGLYSYFDGATLTNCILWDNTSGQDHPEIYILNGSGPHVGYSDIAGCGGSGAWNASFGINDGGNIDNDPLFVDADGADNIFGTADDNLRLGFLSPCIDAGTNAGVTTDIRGQSRPYDILDVDHNGAQPEYDMGAFEEVMFRFTFSADNRPNQGNQTRWHNVLAQMRDLTAGRWAGMGQFHIAGGDIDDPGVTDLEIHSVFPGTGVYWYPVVGNHEAETAADMTWIRDEYNTGHNGRPALKTHTKQNGPTSSKETTYSFEYGNAHIIVLNEYWDGTSDIGTDGDVVNALYQWLIDDLYANTKSVVMVTGHEPAFPEFRHLTDSLNKYPSNRDRFWKVLNDRKVLSYLTGHTHFFCFKRIEDSLLANPFFRWDPFTWQIDGGNAGNENPSEAPLAWSATLDPDDQTFVDIYVSDTIVEYASWMGNADNPATPFQHRYGWSQDIPVDTTAPQLASLVTVDSTHIEVVFDEWMKSTTTNVVGNYSIVGGGTITITSAAIDRLALNPDYDYKRVRLTLSSSTPLVTGTTYTLTINNLQDKAGNALAAGTARQFRLVPQTPGGGTAPTITGNPTPANNATGVVAPAALSVTVNDAESNPLDITFYGRSAEAFTVVVLPDTQNYLEPAANRAIFTEQTQWIVTNRALHNIVFVVHEGDIVDNLDGFDQAAWNQEWAWAAESMDLLYGQVPYSVLPGNHDFRNNAGGQSYYNLYFPYTDFEAFPWYDGHYGTNNFNSYQRVSCGGVNLLFMNLQWRPNADMIHWADMVQKANSDCAVIFTTHGLISTSGGFTLNGWGTADPFPDPQDLWNGMSRNENLYFMLCGHEPGQRNQSNASGAPAEFAHQIYTLLADYQNEANGGNGYMRVMRFVPSADRVYVEKYSPHLNPNHTPADVIAGADYQAPFVMDKPFAVIGKSFVNGSGTATMNWTGLNPATTYEWYIVIGDSMGNATTGTQWSFTTGN